MFAKNQVVNTEMYGEKMRVYVLGMRVKGCGNESRGLPASILGGTGHLHFNKNTAVGVVLLLGKVLLDVGIVWHKCYV